MNPPDSRPPPPFEDSPDYVQSLHRGLEVVRAFSDERPAMTLSELAQRARLSRAVVRRVLLTLEHLGYVARHERLFSLTPRVLELGYGYLASLPITDIALPYMEELSRSVLESCSMSVLDGSDIVYVQRVPVRKVVAITLAVGARLPAHCTSMGRVLLAGLDREALARWLQDVQPRARTRFTLTDTDALKQELQRVRTQGYAYVEQEFEEGLCSVAVPLHDRRGRVVAALNLGMPFRAGARERVRKDILPPLRRTALLIERSLPTGLRNPGS